MKRKEDFLAEIIETPDDDAPRLIFADWLEEQGDTDRSEFIRIQCELAKAPECPKITELREEFKAAHRGTSNAGRFVMIPPAAILQDQSETLTIANYCYCLECRLTRREQELLGRTDAMTDRQVREPESSWLPSDVMYLFETGPRKGQHNRFWTWRRGFIAEITLPCADWIAHREEILRMCPLEKVTLVDHWKYVRRHHPGKWEQQARAMTEGLSETWKVVVSEYHRLVILCRNQERAEAVVSEMNDEDRRIMLGDAAAPAPQGIISFPPRQE